MYTNLAEMLANEVSNVCNDASIIERIKELKVIDSEKSNFDYDNRKIVIDAEIDKLICKSNLYADYCKLVDLNLELNDTYCDLYLIADECEESSNEDIMKILRATKEVRDRYFALVEKYRY
jgi:hypothetical protein